MGAECGASPSAASSRSAPVSGGERGLKHKARRGGDLRLPSVSSEGTGGDTDAQDTRKTVRTEAALVGQSERKSGRSELVREMRPLFWELSTVWDRGTA